MSQMFPNRYVNASFNTMTMWGPWCWRVSQAAMLCLSCDWFFLHLDTRASISFLTFVKCVLIHYIIISFLFSWTIFHTLDKMPSNLKIWSEQLSFCNVNKNSWRFLNLPRVSWVNRCQMTDRLTGHFVVSKLSKVNLFGLQIGKCIQHALIWK